MQLFKGEQVMALRIKNWSKHQHFKDRTPPWIKLYRDILDDPDWHDLDGDSAKILISLWLIASEDDSHTGVLPDERRLAFRLRISEKQLKIHLNKLSNWLIRDDIETISDRHQSDAPERAGEETETETETEAPKDSAKFDFLKSLTDNEVDLTVAKDYIALRKAKKCVQTETAFKALANEADKANLSIADAVAICCKKSWGGFDASWIKPEDRPKKESEVFDLQAWTRKMMA